MAERAVSAVADSQSGPCLNDFQQVKLLGEGAFAAVYKVIRHADGQTYALKKVKLPSLSDKEKKNALNEIRLLASVHHENVISYKDAFFDDRTRCLCIVTELADGGDLMVQITACQKKKSYIPERDIWRYLIGLARALQALHSATIFHRDLKSANVFLSQSRNGAIAKLGDFNVSTVAKKGLCLTQTGTPYYASPEIWRDMPYDGKSDIWGLGCVMYEAAALKPPFRANDMEGLYKKVLQGKFSRIPSIFSQDLADTISTLLQVNPRYRPSPQQILEAPLVCRKASDCGLAGTSIGTSNLLSTIKVPKKLIDLSAYLPEAQYSMHKTTVDEQASYLGQARAHAQKLPSLITSSSTPEKFVLKAAQRRKASRRIGSLPALHQHQDRHDSKSPPLPDRSPQAPPSNEKGGAARFIRDITPPTLAAKTPHSDQSSARREVVRLPRIESMPSLQMQIESCVPDSEPSLIC